MIRNPQAYPCTYQFRENEFIKQHGMTLLDYYAGLAMQSVLNGVYINQKAQEAISKLATDRDVSDTRIITDLSYSYAISMLKSREHALKVVDSIGKSECNKKG